MYAVELLLEVFGSGGLVDLTVAVLAMNPFCVGFTTTVTVAVAPPASVPTVHVTVLVDLLRVQVPCVELAETKPVVFGSGSVAVTPLAVLGPLFLTAKV